MPRRPRLAAVFAALFLLAAALPACGGAPEAAPAPPAGEEIAAEAIDEAPPLVGTVTRAELEAHRPDWVAAQVEAQPDAEAAQALLAVEPGATVTVYLGTWCSDSKRELPRLWRALDDAGVFDETELPFELEYVAVDRDKVEPAGRAAAAGLDYVPTFVVTRGGEEVGRMVEQSVPGIEHDLLALLSGEASGVLSARDDVGASPPPDAPSPAPASTTPADADGGP
jgi:hypothetical protein